MFVYQFNFSFRLILLYPSVQGNQWIHQSLITCSKLYSIVQWNVPPSTLLANITSQFLSISMIRCDLRYQRIPGYHSNRVPGYHSNHVISNLRKLWRYDIMPLVHLPKAPNRNSPTTMYKCYLDIDLMQIKPNRPGILQTVDINFNSVKRSFSLCVEIC